MERTEVSRNQLVNQLLHVGHGNLDIYIEVGSKAVQEEPELFGHLIVWNQKKGEVRDSKVALPVLALRGNPDKGLYENAVANLCRLDPKNLLKAILFSRGLTAGKIRTIQKVPVTSTGIRKTQYVQKKVEIPVAPAPLGFGAGKILEKGITLYIRARESNRKWWNDTAIQHRRSLKSLYALGRIKPAPFAQDILFGRPTGKMIKSSFDGKLKPEIGPRIYPRGSVFEKVKDLKNMSPKEAAGTILNYGIPFIIAIGASGKTKDEPDIILALIEQMSGAELVNNTQMLQRYGIFESPPLKAAYDKAIERTRKDTRVSSLKATRAAEVVTDKKASRKLKQIQDQRLQELGGVEGDWLVLGDRSGSMSASIIVAINIASLIAQQVKGKVYLTLFNTAPSPYDVTGKTLEQINDMTKRLTATGGTSIGCGLDLLQEKGILINGIAICSDGGDNTIPFFHEAYKRYTKKFSIEPPVYLFHVPGDADQLSVLCEREGILIEKFQLGRNVDFYSLPNIVKTLRTSRYTLIEEIMEMPLLGFTDVFKELATN